MSVFDIGYLTGLVILGFRRLESVRLDSTRFQGDFVEHGYCSLDGVDREDLLFGRYIAIVRYSTRRRIQLVQDPFDRNMVTLIRIRSGGE